MDGFITFPSRRCLMVQGDGEEDMDDVRELRVGFRGQILGFHPLTMQSLPNIPWVFELPMRNDLEKKLKKSKKGLWRWHKVWEKIQEKWC